METNLLSCQSLLECDVYFSSRITPSKLIGDVEITHAEFEYLGKLLAEALSSSDINPSLSLAVFLTWSGVYCYRGGNYWSPVLAALKLSQDQLKYQIQLGDAFLEILKKHDLFSIDTLGWERYVTSILVHGYIPDFYLDNYIENFIFVLYRDMVQAGQGINKNQVTSTVSIIRRNFEKHMDFKNSLDVLREEETELESYMLALKFLNELNDYRELFLKGLTLSQQANSGDWSDDWLVNAEKRKAEIQQQYNLLCTCLNQEQEVLKSRENLQEKSNGFRTKANMVLQNLFLGWDDFYFEGVKKLPLQSVGRAAKNYAILAKPYSGLWGKILKIIRPKRYQEKVAAKNTLADLLSSLPPLNRVDAVWIEAFGELEKLLAEYKETIFQLTECDKAIEEVAASYGGPEMDLGSIEEQLNELSNEINGYKARYTEAKEKWLLEQKETNQRLESLENVIPGNPAILLRLLPKAQASSPQSLMARLVMVRKEKEICLGKLRFFNNPMYNLIEPTRAFIIKGGDKASQFVYDSILVMHAACRKASLPNNQLPGRISTAIVKWWQDFGQTLFREEVAPEQTANRLTKTGYVTPSIYLDTLEPAVVVRVPAQKLAGRPHMAVFAVGGTGAKIERPLLLQRMGEGLQTLPIQVYIEPQAQYVFTLACDSEVKEWRFGGPGQSNFSLLFESRQKLVNGNHLPSGYAWFVAPTGFNIYPEEIVREQEGMHDAWSGYTCTLVDLDDADVVLVQSGKNVDIYHRKTIIEPTYIGGKYMQGVTTWDGLPIYLEKMPGLVFSIDDREELFQYSIRFVHGAEDKYISVEECNPIVNADGGVFVDLSRVFPDSYGMIKVCLIHKGYKTVWAGICAVTPFFRVEFGRELYLPATGEPTKEQVTISAQVPFAFYPDSPSKTSEFGGRKMVVEFYSIVSSITGVLKFRDMKINISINVPGIRWRPKGDENWRADVAEIWHKDLGLIEVKASFPTKSPAKLSVEGSQQSIERPIIKGIATFDATVFFDYLWFKGKEICQVMLSVNGTTCPLFTIRLAWRVSDVITTDVEEDGSRVINLSWRDHGQQISRLVRLWAKGRPDTIACEVPIEDGDSRVVVTAPIESLPAGRYTLQFTWADPWSSEKISQPGLEEINCFQIMLGELAPIDVKWRWLGEREWKPAPDTLWYEDIDTIELLAPDDGITCSLDFEQDGKHVASIGATGPRLIFDLASQKDTFAAQPRPTDILVNCNTGTCHLLTVFSRWDVSNARCQIRPEGEKWEFIITWEQQVSAPGRFIRIWSPELEEIGDWPIPDLQYTKLIFLIPKKKCPGGRYVIQFAQGKVSKPNFLGVNELYEDVPLTVNRVGSRSRTKAHKNPERPEYKCPIHNLILPTGTYRCDCGYQVEPFKKEFEHLRVRRKEYGS